MVKGVTGARRYGLLASFALLFLALVGSTHVGAQVAEDDVLTFTLDGPSGPQSADEPVSGDGTAEHDFGIGSFGTYTWSILDDAGDEVGIGTIVVDEGEQPCAAADLEEGDSCAGVTHSPLDASPSFITLATHQPIAAVTTTAAPAPTTGATTPPTDSPPAPEEAADEDDSSTPWGLVAGLGGGLVLIGLGVTRFFGSSSSSESPSESPSGGPPATIVTVPPPTSTESEPQVCRVEVQANEINGLGIYHLCLIFTDEHGARYFRGGPGETTLKDGLLGRVTGHTGKHVPGAVDWEPGCPTVLIAEGPDVCAKKELLFDELSRINRMGAAYELEGPNSNTTVRRLLRAAGLPEEKPDVLTPGWDHDGLDPEPPKPTGPGPKPAPAPVPKPPTPPPAGGPGR